MTTAVRDRSTVDLDLVKSYLKITGTASDALLTLWLGGAKRAADAYLNNAFLTRNPAFNPDLPPDPTANPFWSTTEEAIPEPVELGILEYVGWHWFGRRRARNVTEEKVGDIAQKFAVLDTAQDMLGYVQATWWAPHRLTPLGGSV